MVVTITKKGWSPEKTEIELDANSPLTSCQRVTLPRSYACRFEVGKLLIDVFSIRIEREKEIELTIRRSRELRETDIERDGDRERQTDRQIERERERDRQTETEIESDTDLFDITDQQGRSP